MPGRRKCQPGCTCGLHRRKSKLDWNDPEALRAYHNAYYAANRERIRGQQRPSERTRRLWSLYRLTPERYAQLAEDQRGLCYLCSEPLDFENEDKRTVCIDHDHSCCRGQRSCGSCIRGLACHACNKAVGYLGDDPERMRRVADNLEMANRRLRNTSGSRKTSVALAPHAESEE